VLETALRVVGEPRLIEPDGDSRVLTVGAAVHAGDRLETTTGARAALSLGTGRSLRLDRDTTATLAAAERVELARGGVYVSSEPEAPGALAVATALGLAREVGTRFAVELDGEQLAVRVRDGSVVLESDDERFAVPAGEELTRSARGEIARRPLSASDPSWEWVVATAPPFDLEGATAEEYLAWMARETGWQVVYDSSETARAASAAVLHGSLDGDDPRDTLEMVLPTADLAYRLEGGVLHVFPALGEPESRLTLER
jgi:ferric-dicitrate binding protein FerR (iron transport regulator)